MGRYDTICIGGSGSLEIIREGAMLMTVLEVLTLLLLIVEVIKLVYKISKR